VGTRPVTIPVVAVEADRREPAIVEGRGDDADAAQGLVDRDLLLRALEQCGWVQAKAARLLKLTPRQIGYAIRKHGIAVKQL
jgi:Nif-specific regulatory protein